MTEYDKMDDYQLRRFASDVAENSTSAEEVRRRIFGLGYPFQFFFVEKRTLRRGFGVVFQGHQWLISVK